ncbi:MAG: response regulator [Cellvibrionaceae bacterium]|nr:response regulator [Cellvibrionaceae bacterium]MCV6626459.1 response regulator [Cellvibrionaceae bacterium]
MDFEPADLSLLLVEPSATQQKIICNELQNNDITNISRASSISEAKQLLEQQQPDLIASAMYFDDGTGLDLLKGVRASALLSETPFMLVSSEWRKDQLEAFKQSGVVAILPKPFSRLHLGKAIDATIDLLSYDEMELDHYDVTELRVLVVDDSALARKYIAKVLISLGINNIIFANDGEQAKQMMSMHMLDLVVTDYNMPNVNGRELTEYIRQQSDQSHVPILMVSSEANETHLQQIENAGVNALCDKPFEPQTVRQLLYSILEH